MFNYLKYGKLKFIFTIITITLSLNLQGQNENGNNKRICIGNVTLLYFYDGIFFEPVNESSNLPDSVLCNTYVVEFYLNGLKISKESFLNLKLSSKHLRNDSITSKRKHSGYGTYEYHFGQNSKCADKIIFRVETKLPIYLNGENFANPDSILRQLNPGDVISVERKVKFLGKSRIEIKTK